MSTLVVAKINDPNGQPLLIAGGFYKADPTSVAFTKTGAGTAEVKAGTIVAFADGTQVAYSTATAITMPSLTAGTDYAIWADKDGSIQATADHTSPPETGSRKIGGFHYAPGGNATGTSGGDTTPAINAYSFWDLKFKPSAPDPRGKTLIADGFWSDIYLLNTDPETNGTSAYNKTIADGSSPPKVPTKFGGNGITTYGSLTWFEAMEIAAAHGMRCPTQQEFMALAYGTTEASSVGADQVSTILNAAYTSKWGIMQASGVMQIWGRDRGGAYNTGGWNANTEGRGSEYNAPKAVLFGGNWFFTSNSGSRCSYWTDGVSSSGNHIVARLVCDHLILD